MKKRLILTSLVAIATSSIANAATDVTFGGDYTNTSGATVNVADAVANQTYSYEKSDGSTRTVTSQSTNPTLSDFTYTDKDGSGADLSTGPKTQGYFTGDTAASGDVTTTQDIVSGATVSRSNYEYTNGKGERVTLGSSAQDMVENVTLNPNYVSDTTIVVTNGVADSSVNGTMYNMTVGTATYHLSSDGTKLVNSLEEEVTPTPGSTLADAFDAMQTAYNTDVATIASATTTTAANYATEVTNFTAADTAYTTDVTTVATLDTRWGTYETAAGLLATAEANQSAAQEVYAANSADKVAALDVYNAPITTTIANGANDAIDTSIASGSIKSALDTKADTATVNDETTRATAQEAAIRGEFAAADTTLQNNIDAETTRAQGEEAAIRSEFAAADTTLQNNINAEATARQAADTTLQANIDAEASTRAAADTTLQNNIDVETARAQGEEAAIRSEFATADALTLQQAQAYASAGDALTLQKANAYTDSKVNTLEKNVSGGVAAATALSAVSVSNVGKGEVSVGAGYGYYNSQSAMAFGAAMGLSDNWSVNAGAGIASGDKTQVSFRAGTNYKFKLF